MATFDVPPIGLNVKPPQQTSLADMLGIARGAQAYQQAEQINPLALQQQQQAARTGQIALSVEEQKDLERKNLQYLIGKEPHKLLTDGVYNPQKATEEILKIAPLTGMAHLKDIASSFGAQEGFKTAETGTQSAKMKFAGDQVLGIAGRLTGLINNPLIIAAEQNPNEIDKDKLTARVKKYADEQAVALGIPKEKAEQLIGPYLEQAVSNPAGLRQFLKDKLLSTLDQGSRLTAMQPSGVDVSTGAGGYKASTGEFSQYQPGTPLPGTAYETQIPPTTEIVNPITGAKKLIGPMSMRPKEDLTTNVGPAQAGLISAAGTSIGEDWAKTVADAKEAQPRIAIFQNIKKFAPDSFTGTGGQRKELAAGILNAIGISAYEAEKVSTEELAKNSALLALAGGNTDASRALAEIANPNKKLNEKAILAIADQMIGIDKMKAAREAFLSPVQNDAVQYAQRQRQFNSLSDPRLFQEMSREDVEKLRKSMSPAQQAEMSAKIKQAKQLGIIP